MVAIFWLVLSADSALGSCTRVAQEHHLEQSEGSSLWSTFLIPTAGPGMSTGKV